MYFAIIATDVENSLEKRLSVRDKHLARLKVLKQQNRLLIAGPHPATEETTPQKPAFTGSLIIAEFDSQRAARDWASNDPYIEAGVYENVVVKPFLKVQL